MMNLKKTAEEINRLRKLVDNQKDTINKCMELIDYMSDEIIKLQDENKKQKDLVEIL